MKAHSLSLLLMMLTSACMSVPTSPVARIDDAWVVAIEDAHGSADFHRNKAVEAQLVYRVGVQRVLDGRLLITTGESRARVDRHQGASAVFDGKAVHVTGGGSEFPSAEGHLRLWPRLLKLPFALPAGGLVRDDQPATLHGRQYAVARLRFAADPDPVLGSESVLYVEPASHIVAGITFTPAVAVPGLPEGRPITIKFDEHVYVGRSLVPLTWRIYASDAATTLPSEPLGMLTLHKARYVKPQRGELAGSASSAAR